MIVLAEPTPQAVAGTVDRVATPGVYLVRDQVGRMHRAQSAELWRRGDRVTVINGQIVARANPATPTKTYEV